MKKHLLYYLDTSIFGGYYDNEFITATRLFWKQLSSGLFTAVLSDLVLKELERAPLPIQELRDSISQQCVIIPVTDEILDLANHYIKAGIVTSLYANDAIHVASATISPAKALVSWNFRHLVNLKREEGFNGVNLLQGYRQIRIVSPKEVLEYDEPER